MGATQKMADTVGGAPKVNGHVNGTSNSYASKFEIPSHFIGGSTSELSQAPPSRVKDFVAANDGHSVITNVSASMYQSKVI